MKQFITLCIMLMPLQCDSMEYIRLKIEEEPTELYIAVRDNAFVRAKLLLETGNADPNIPCLHKKLTPLHVACKNNALKLVELLILHNANINAKTAHNATPLHYAVNYRLYKVAECLLQNGADVSIKTNFFDKYGTSNIIFYLTDIPTISKQTALEIAKVNKDKKMIALLKSYQKKKCIIQ